jgi:hypothetical protein
LIKISGPFHSWSTLEILDAAGKMGKEIDWNKEKKFSS